MKSTNALCIGLSTLIITACGSPKDANEKNFTNAINDYLDTQCPIAYVAAEFPTVVATDSPKQRPSDVEELEYLKTQGLLTAEQGQLAVEDRYSKKEELVTGTIYDLSDEGKARFSHTKGIAWGKRTGFCVAGFELDSIDNFTDPSDVMGYTISNVKYTASPIDVLSWATSEQAKQYFPDLEEELVPEQKMSATLILTNDGWQHEEIFKQQ